MREEIHGPTEIFQGIQVVGRILPRELDVVDDAGLPDDFHKPGPDDMDMDSQGGLAGLQEIAQDIFSLFHRSTLSRPRP